MRHPQACVIGILSSFNACTISEVGTTAIPMVQVRTPGRVHSHVPKVTQLVSSGGRTLPGLWTVEPLPKHCRSPSRAPPPSPHLHPSQRLPGWGAGSCPLRMASAKAAHLDLLLFFHSCGTWLGCFLSPASSSSSSQFPLPGPAAGTPRTRAAVCPLHRLLGSGFFSHQLR